MLSRRNFAVIATTLGLAASSALGAVGSASGATIATAKTLSFAEALSDGSTATGVNDSGQAVGTGSVFTGYTVIGTGRVPIWPTVVPTHATKTVLWNGSTPTDFTPSGTDQSYSATHAYVSAIADDGTAIGDLQTTAGGVLWFVYKSGKLTLLPSGMEAVDVANNGLVLVTTEQNIGTPNVTTTFSSWNNGTLTTLAILAGTGQTGRINSSGVAAIVDGDGNQHDFVRMAMNGTVVTLPLPNPIDYISIVDVTDSGRILADLGFAEGVVWTAAETKGVFTGSTVFDTGTTSGGAIPLAINESGTVVGTQGLGGYGYGAAQWGAAGGSPTVLTTGLGAATGIADNGTVIGFQGGTAADTAQPAMWRNGTSVAVPTATGSTNTQLTAINRKGTEVVGQSTTASGTHAAAWTVAG